MPLGLKAINVESAGELARVEAIAGATGAVARVAVRVNPDIDSGSHPAHFHRPQDQQVRRAARRCRASCVDDRRPPRLKLVAVHVHVGSQITTLEPLRRAAAIRRRVMSKSSATPACRSSTSIWAAGSGFPTTARGAVGGGVCGRPGGGDAADRAADRHRAGPRDCRPGAVLVARVIDIKPRDASSDFAVIDAGMTELMRPALYGAFHRIEPVWRRATRRPREYEMVGPVCESSDVVGRDRSCRRSRLATSSPSAMPARTDPRWRRITIAGRCRPRCSWTTEAGG